MAKSKLRHGTPRISQTEIVQQNPKKEPRAFDPALTTLFQNSLGPVKPVTKCPPWSTPLLSAGEPDETLGASSTGDSVMRDPISETSSEETYEPTSSLQTSQSMNDSHDLARSVRKRKRHEAEDDVEGTYLSRLAQQEAKEQEHRLSKAQQKHPKLRPSESSEDGGTSFGSDNESGTDDIEIIAGDQTKNLPEGIPQHESMDTSKGDLDLEKSTRTVFLANVSTSAIKSKSARKVLLDHLISFTSSLPSQYHGHRVESLRFRSTAFTSNAIPRKAAFARKELMDATTKSTNAYAVYTTQLAAREASKRLNGTTVLDRHLRVDLVAHPAKIDHRRCVFVGNLGFVDDMSNINAAQDEENKKPLRKAKEPADMEEGLWRQFGNAGTVESVRVVRDKTTRVGKGFAYVQFVEANAVEKALLYNAKKFPPMLPRILRVTRAKNVKTAASQKEKKEKNTRPKQDKGSAAAAYNPKTPAQFQSLSGRAGKLLGRAGAAQIKAKEKTYGKSSKDISVAKRPELVVFEGYTASRQQGKGAMKLGPSGKSQGKPHNRSSRRGADFNARGGKKKARN